MCYYWVLIVCNFQVQSEKVQRELLEKEMESIKSNKVLRKLYYIVIVFFQSTHFNGDDQSTTTNLQVGHY